MTRNNIIDFLYDQSTKRDAMLFTMLKDENMNMPQFEDKSIYKAEESKPQFANLSKCKECRFWNNKIKGCISQVAVCKGCGEPNYKYFEER